MRNLMMIAIANSAFREQARNFVLTLVAGMEYPLPTVNKEILYLGRGVLKLEA
jgi:hypothetical protein